MVLLKPREAGFEVLLTRRPQQMKFLGGYYVFPGGAVRESDGAPRTLGRCLGVEGAQARRLLGGAHSAETALAHWVAAARELFEEVGVLLCVNGDGSTPGSDGAGRLEAKRRALARDELEFGEFLESEDLYCDLGRLAYFFHRVTPEFYPTRFDTRFYLAALPENQTALERSEEVAGSLWIDPKEALARARRHDFPLLPPTTTVLQEISRLTWAEIRSRYRLR